MWIYCLGRSFCNPLGFKFYPNALFQYWGNPRIYAVSRQGSLVKSIPKLSLLFDHRRCAWLFNLQAHRISGLSASPVLYLWKLTGVLQPTHWSSSRIKIFACPQPFALLHASWFWLRAYDCLPRSQPCRDVCCFIFSVRRMFKGPQLLFSQQGD